MPLKNRIARSVGLAMAFFVNAAGAIEWTASSHRVLVGDYNGDGMEDFYLAARPLPLALPLNGMTSLVIPRSQHDVVLLRGAHGQYTTLTPPDPAILRRTTWKETNYSVQSGDFNGDGIADLLLRPQGANQEALLLTLSKTGTPSVAQVLDSRALGIELSVSGGYRLEWRDVDGDGKADLLMSKPGVPTQVLYATAAGFTAAKVLPVSPSSVPVGDQPLQANAWGLAEGSVQVSLDGRTAYALPLEMPMGVNGLQPSLAIGYQMGARDGYLGVGWGLSGLPSIHRCAATVAQDQYSGAPSGSAMDKLCLDGQRLQLVSGTEWQPGSIYRTEIDSFTQVTLKGTASDPHFEARSRNGWIITLGKTTSSRLIPVGGKPLAWQVDSIKDRFDNTLAVTYSSADGTLLPLSIDYAGAKVEFSYRARSGTPRQFALGGEVKLDKLLERVTTYAPGGGQLREYRIGYQYSANTKLPRVAHVQNCGILEGDRQCLEANTFTYLDQPSRLEGGQLLTTSKPMVGKFLSVETPIDWNGDGFNDLLTVNFDAIYVAPGGPNGLGANVKVVSPPVDSLFLTASPIDVNGDGKQEVLYLSAKNGKPNQLTWAYEDAQGTAKTVATWTADNYNGVITNFSGSVPGADVLATAAKAVVFDFSHDGRPDLLLPINGTWQLYENRTGTTSGFVDSKRMSGIAVSADGSPWFTPFALEGNGTWQLLTTINKNGKQTFATLPVPREGSVGAGQKVDLDIAVERAVMLDVNGDGLLDFVAPNASNLIVLHLNKGGAAGPANFHQQVTGLSSTGIFADAGLRRENKDYLPTPLDMDGDGQQDLLYINHAAQRYEVLRSTGAGLEASAVTIPLVVGTESYNASKQGCENFPQTRAQMIASINAMPEAMRPLFI